jgi:hypothetical protein
MMKHPDSNYSLPNNRMIDSMYLYSSSGHSNMGWIRGYTETMHNSTMAPFDIATLHRAMLTISDELEGRSDFFTMGIGLPRRPNINTF